jgi:predicted Co/Zn/Cd cation transporter (cation efflux family)
MNNLNHYQREMKQIAQDAAKTEGKGHWVAWLMMIVGVVVTGTMTYALTAKGMASSRLWRTWVDVAAFFPVVLLEGSALALVYGRHHWFRSEEQRRIANTASWVIWGLLATTSVVHFAFGETRDGTIKWLMSVYASYVLPLAIVGVPMLWKKLYDSAPDSMMRIAVLENEASLRSRMVDVEREQNGLMIQAYREALDTPRVTAARRALFEQASIEHARNISGFIEGTGTEATPAGPLYVNGKTTHWDQVDDRPKN